MRKTRDPVTGNVLRFPFVFRNEYNVTTLLKEWRKDTDFINPLRHWCECVVKLHNNEMELFRLPDLKRQQLNKEEIATVLFIYAMHLFSFHKGGAWMDGVPLMIQALDSLTQSEYNDVFTPAVLTANIACIEELQHQVRKNVDDTLLLELVMKLVYEDTFILPVRQRAHVRAFMKLYFVQIVLPNMPGPNRPLVNAWLRANYFPLLHSYCSVLLENNQAPLMVWNTAVASNRVTYESFWLNPLTTRLVFTAIYNRNIKTAHQPVNEQAVLLAVHMLYDAAALLLVYPGNNFEKSMRSMPAWMLRSTLLATLFAYKHHRELLESSVLKIVAIVAALQLDFEDDIILAQCSQEEIDFMYGIPINTLLQELHQPQHPILAALNVTNGQARDLLVNQIQARGTGMLMNAN